MQEKIFSEIIEQQILSRKDKFSPSVTILVFASYTHTTQMFKYSSSFLSLLEVLKPEHILLQVNYLSMTQKIP